MTTLPDTQQFTQTRHIYSHNDYCVLTAGNKQTTVQYWSLYDNKILRKFKGHTSSIYEINVCPTEDMFLTSSKDQTVRLWNLKQAGCLAKMDLPKDSVGLSSNPRAVFDSTGMVFTVMAEMARGEGHYIHLYDARNYQGGAFSELKLTSKAINEAMVTQRVPPPPPKAAGSSPLTIDKISFNESGNRILVHASEGYAMVLDGYEGTIQRIFRSSRGNAKVSCFTPDEKSLLVGSDTDGLVDVYDLQSGSAVAALEGGHGGGSITALACNPKYAQIASGGAVNTRCVSISWSLYAFRFVICIFCPDHPCVFLTYCIFFLLNIFVTACGYGKKRARLMTKSIPKLTRCCYLKPGVVLYYSL